MSKASMSKIRVYELAKELGLENKAVIELCEQLGMSGKQSHSNTLLDEEADRLRRSVIRRAVSERSGATREIQKEGAVVTEQRVGNVIRRRKKETDEEDEISPKQPPRAQLDLSSPSSSSLEGRSEIFEVHQPKSRQEALARADALFHKQGEPRESREIVERASLQSVREKKARQSQEVTDQTLGVDVSCVGQQETAIKRPEQISSEITQDKKTEALQEEGTKQVQHTGQTTFIEHDQEGAPQLGHVVQSEPHEPQAKLPITQAGDPLHEVRRRHDIRAPKVLGKIDLPVRAVGGKKTSDTKIPVSSEDTDDSLEKKEGEKDSSGAIKVHKGKRKVGVQGNGVLEVEELKPRLRKKQILRKDDLLDYEGERDLWRHRKDKKSKRGDIGKQNGQEFQEANAPRATKRIVKISGEISVSELSRNLGAKASEVLLHLLNLGVKATINQLVDYETATLIAAEFGFTVVNTGYDEEEHLAGLNKIEKAGNLTLRSPVVTVMGHVDHGKTSLLDAIRKTSVTTLEAGGITQHIGAYNIVLPSGGSVTFLDTPGHEAFTAMRSRGAKVTDIVVLVVAADDGVMPQTVEAISHAKAAGVPILVAINKIDKPGADPERIKSQLSEHGLIPEDWGGETIIVPVSANTKQGVDLLLENLHLQAEILELKAAPDSPARGTVIESKIDRGRGPVISVLVQNGTLKKGDVFLAGAVCGKARALVADDGTQLLSAGPSIPVEVLGASDVPLAGDDFYVLSSEAEAKRIAEFRLQRIRLKELASKGVIAGAPLTLADFSEFLQTGGLKELPVIIKADVQGSVEAVAEALKQLATEEVRVKILHQGVGAITENDVQLAVASKAVVVGFNVRSETRAASLIDQERVQILYSRIIYELVEMVQSAMKGKLDPKFQETTLGRVEVRETFKVPKLGTIAGSYVIDGVIQRGALVRLLRDNRVVFEGKMASLRRFKDDVKEVTSGYECGIGIEGYSDIQMGDVIEVYRMEQVH